MKNSALMKKIADSLIEVCVENNISLIKKIIIEIANNYKIKDQDLLNFLLEEVGLFIGINSKVVISLSEFTNSKFEFILIEGFDRNNNFISLKGK